jgi:cellulose synthase/poly-beta-1,6-N-acetylglucosamine synthase-like glycosyltransferase
MEAMVNKNQSTPFSALVAAWNEGEGLEVHIRSFLALDWPGSELIVCAGGKDNSYQRAKQFERPSITVLEQTPGMGKQAALRECYKHARHGLIFLTDADCLFDGAALAKLLHPLITAQYQVATGGSYPLPKQQHNLLVQYQGSRDVFFYAHQGQEADGVLGRNIGLTRECLERIGRFDAVVHTGTDYHMSLKLKEAHIAIAQVKGSEIASAYPETPQHYLRQQRRWIKNLVIHQSQDTRSIYIAAMLAALFCLSPLLLLLPGWFKLLVLPIWLRPFLARWRDLRFANQKGLKVNPLTHLMIPYYTLLDQLAVLGAVRDLLAVESRQRW